MSLVAPHPPLFFSLLKFTNQDLGKEMKAQWLKCFVRVFVWQKSITLHWLKKGGMNSCIPEVVQEQSRSRASGPNDRCRGNEIVLKSLKAYRFGSLTEIVDLKEWQKIEVGEGKRSRVSSPGMMSFLIRSFDLVFWYCIHTYLFSVVSKSQGTGNTQQSRDRSFADSR